MSPKARYTVIICVLIFMVLHHDFWLWHNQTLLFGFLPAGLAYHIGYSISVALFWYLVMKFAWPSAIEKFAASEDREGDKS